MKKRFTAVLLMAGMLAGQITGIPALAENGRNVYGHSVTYEPVTELYTGGEPIRLFDSQITEWGKIGSDGIIQNEAESIKWLSENNYLLNHFGQKFSTKVDTPGCFNSKGEWQTQLKGPTNVYRWDANVRFDKLVNEEERLNGNISNIYNKGDLQYFFSWKVKTVQTSWKLIEKSNDTGFTVALGENTFSSGGGWKKYNTVGNGPNLGNLSAWKSGKKLNFISFTAKSDKDKQVDSYLSGAMLVGRDAKGPQISSVKVTADAEGTKEIENGAITLDTIENLSDRTVYFQVQWDEPIVFENMKQSDIAKLSLDVETIGIDGTSGMIAEAPFLKFAPSKTDAMPTMVFEYKIADPYTDTSAVTQERGYFYRFSNVTVSEKENEQLWNNIYDISGNKFATDENGQQPAGKVVTAVSASTYVDLMPFGIENIRMTRDQNDGNAFITAGGLLGVTLELNKKLTQDVKVKDLPVITLNIKDPSGKNVTIKPDENDMVKKIKFKDEWIDYGYFYKDYMRIQPVMLGDDNKSITYYVQLYPGYVMDGDAIKIISVSSDKQKIKDSSGYSLMDYSLDGNILAPEDIPNGAESKKAQYSVSPDKQYKFDFDAPIADLSVNDLGEGIVALTVSAEDNSLTGCETVFTVNVNGNAAKEGISYQAASSDNYNDTEWKSSENGSMILHFGAPIIEKGGENKAYGFIKLPQDCEADKITVSAAVVDEAQNSASTEKEISAPDWKGYDTLSPRIKLSVKQEEISVDISDIDDDITYDYGFSDDEVSEPAYTSAAGKSGIISAPELPEENKIFTKVLWIKAKDSSGNESEVTKLGVKYDRTYTEIKIKSADTDTKYVAGKNPIVFFEVKEATAYWCLWAEKPANVSDTAAYISENCLDDMKNRAMDYGIMFKSDDGMPKDFTNRIAELDESSIVAAIDAKTEKYTQDIYAEQTSRPIMLIIAAEKEDGGTLVKTIEFDTYYGAPKAKIEQSRFSTNNSSGKRVDYTINGEMSQLLQASDTDKYDYPLNTPSLYGFAQAEFKLVGDPITGLDRVDISKSYVTLDRVFYSGTDLNGEEKERRSIGEWSFSELGLGELSESAVIDIDPKSLDANYYSVDEEGNRLAVRYEFVSNMSYSEGIKSDKSPIAYFAFNNEPNAFLHDVQYDAGSWISRYSSLGNYENKNIEAVFDKSGKDVTANIPVYTITTSYPEEYGYDEYIRFSANGFSYGCDSDNAYYSAPVINTVDADNTSKLAVRIGTDHNDLSEILYFNTSEYDGTVSDGYNIGRHIFGDEKEIREVKLYYRFEYPERGTVSPIYVMKIRRDNVAPVFDISVSETERQTNEVLIKLNGVRDVQIASDGTVVTDTAESELQDCQIAAFREVTENDDISAIPEEDIERVSYYDEKTDKYVFKDYMRIYSDNDGFYHFTSNGYFQASAEDKAGNRSTSFLINGELIEKEEWADFLRYYVDNVSNVPPAFEGEPNFTEDDGKFTLNAKVDDTVKNVYLKFDKAYSEKLSENVSADGDMYNIENIPGMISGEFDSENREVNAEIYIKQESQLSEVTLVIESNSGNKTEYVYNFTSPICGKNAEITNVKNENGYPVYSYGKALKFSVPVKIDGAEDVYSDLHDDIAVYSDGITQITYTDLFGETKTENIYADIFGAAFAHDLIFAADDKEISAQTKVASDVKITVDTSKTKNLSVDGGESEFIFSENGILSYSLYNSEMGERKTFNVPVKNIDKTAPEAIVSIYMDSERDVQTGKQYIYSLTYSIEGFSEENVTLMPSENGAAPSSVSFDGESKDNKYTFRFKDEAGNEGTYTADASGIAFSERKDNKITDYRLTYMIPDENGFKTIGEFYAEDAVEIGLVNKAVSVKIEALNQAGDVVSSAVSLRGDLPEGTKVYENEKLVVFTSESDKERVVELTVAGTGNENAKDISVILPPNAIDTTPPAGTVNYKTDGNIVWAYLVTNDTDLAEDGVYVLGTKNDGTAFELKNDEKGYYTELDANGTGKFVMIDKAGNIGTVAIAVFTIDKEPPGIVSEGWQSVMEAKTAEEIKKLLETPTNSTIKLFMTFNEQLSRAEIEAYENGEDSKKLVPAEEYVTATASGTTLTVEFKKNCRAKLTVYDLKNNPLTIWRPEDGPITAIDKEVPKLLPGYPKRTSENNKVAIEYVFADNEEVMLLQESERGYKNKHIVTISENKSMILNFADRAGNVYSDYPVISEIDDNAPNIKMSVDYVGKGEVLSGNDSYKAGNVYTSKDVRILLNIEDETPDGIIAAAKTKLGKAINVKKENVTSNGKTYNYNFTVSENGSYRVTATDKWGNENMVETNISVIDRTAPTIKFSESTVVVKPSTAEDEVRAQILKNTSAVDLQSGANSPMGDRFGTVADGVKLSVDLSNVKLDKEGKYTAKVTASDRLGNTSQKSCTVNVLKNAYTFSVNGSLIFANDVFTTSKGKIQIQAENETAKYYYAKGYKTAAQMKYAKGFEADEGFEALQNGYYTILAQEEGRKMYLLYVYIN